MLTDYTFTENQEQIVANTSTLLDNGTALNTYGRALENLSTCVASCNAKEFFFFFTLITRDDRVVNSV